MCVLCSVTQLCPTLCDFMDCSPPGSSLCGISQARILEWVFISTPRGSSRPRDGTCVSYVSCIADRFFNLLNHWGSHGLIQREFNRHIPQACPLRRTEIWDQERRAISNEGKTKGPGIEMTCPVVHRSVISMWST